MRTKIIKTKNIFKWRYLLALAVIPFVLSSFVVDNLFAEGPEPQRLSGAIFTTTPGGDIVNENVRYTNKEEVFLDGGPLPNAPGHAAALPPGYYYFQVTDPSGKCLLSSKLDNVDVNGGSCYESVKGKGGPKNAETFEAEPLSCRYFYFDGEDGISFPYATYTIQTKVKGQMVTEVVDCKHLLGSEYDGADLAEGDTIQLYPFANTPNPGGVYKAWVSAEHSVQAACDGADFSIETGENCNGFFGFIPRWSKTDNYKVKQSTPILDFQIGLRAFHDRNLNCAYDPDDNNAETLDDELIHSWDFGTTEPISPFFRGIFATTNSEADPITFSVQGLESLTWLVDQWMWNATANSVNPLNGPFTHVPTFADLRDYAAKHNDGDLHIGFTHPLACQSSQAVSLTTVTTDDSFSTVAAEKSTGDGFENGFIPTDFADAIEVKNGQEPDPVLIVSFGNIGLGEIKVCKVFDSDGDGIAEVGDPKIAGWEMALTIPESVPIPDDIPDYERYPNHDEDNPGAADNDPLRDAVKARFAQSGDPAAMVIDRVVTKLTDNEDGCTDFRILVPNVRPVADGVEPQYIITENPGFEWLPLVPHTYKFDIRSVLTYDSDNKPVINGEVQNLDIGENVLPDVEGADVVFANYCKVTADFDTKGYWHNKNGLAELIEADRVYVNGLDPYDGPSAYFDAGDEPFDGKFTDTTNVAAAFSDGSAVWAGGTWQSEVSHFLTDDNGDAELHGHREQLVQQLLAFIFNTRHRPSPDGLSGSATIEFDGEFKSVSEIVDGAIAAWLSGTDAQRVAYKDILDGLNNNDAVVIIPGSSADCPEPFPTED